MGGRGGGQAWCRIRELGVFSGGAVGLGSAEGKLSSAGAAVWSAVACVGAAACWSGWARAAARSVQDFRIIRTRTPAQHPGHVFLQTKEYFFFCRRERLGHRAQSFRHVPADTTQLIDAPAAQARYEIALIVIGVLTRHPALTIQPHQPA